MMGTYIGNYPRIISIIKDISLHVVNQRSQRPTQLLILGEHL